MDKPKFTEGINTGLEYKGYRDCNFKRMSIPYTFRTNHFTHTTGTNCMSVWLLSIFFAVTTVFESFTVISSLNYTERSTSILFSHSKFSPLKFSRVKGMKTFKGCCFVVILTYLRSQINAWKKNTLGVWSTMAYAKLKK